MEDKNDLNDILLQSEEEEKKDKSNMLLIAAAVLIVFFLGVIGYKILSDTSGTNTSLPTQNNTGAKSDGFSKMDVEQAELKSPETQESKATSQDDIDAKISEIKENFKKDIEEAKKKETPAPAEEKVELKPVETKPAAKETAKPAIVKTTQAPKTQPKVEEKTASGKRDNFYIQIGSFAKGPNEKLLKAISDKGYTYKLKKVASNSKTYTRVYVGPYGNKRDAASALIQVSKDIGLSNAFVIRDY